MTDRSARRLAWALFGVVVLELAAAVVFEVLLAQCVNLLLNIENQRAQTAFDLTRCDLFVVDDCQNSCAICIGDSWRRWLREDLHLRRSA